MLCCRRGILKDLHGVAEMYPSIIKNISAQAPFFLQVFFQQQAAQALKVCAGMAQSHPKQPDVADHKLPPDKIIEANPLRQNISAKQSRIDFLMNTLL